jgi:fibro-slime domain-containing protein
MAFSSNPAGVVLTPETNQFLVPPKKTAGIRVMAMAPISSTFALQARVATQTNNPLCPALPAAEDVAEAVLIVQDPSVRVLTAIVRDFRDTHADFEPAISGLVPDLVQGELGPDGKPIFAGPNGRGSITSAETFKQWFTDVPGVNQALMLPLELRETAPGSGIFAFESSAFFPIDGQLLGNQGRAHNHHFTLELHTTFRYQGGEVLQFTSDDDLWVFIDRRLVVDLGGLHPSVTESVALDALGLTRGQTFAFDLFFAERHTSGSHLQLQTGIAPSSPGGRER